MREKINIFITSITKEKRYLFYGFVIILLLAFIIPKSFSAQVPVKSIIIKSHEVNYDEKAPGSWQVTKSAEWTGVGKARIIFDLDTVLKTENKNTDIIFVLDISGSMNGSKLDRMKADTTELINYLLSNSNNKVALITFESKSTVLSGFTNNKQELTDKINNLQVTGETNYYQSLINVDSILKDYKKSHNRDCVVLFLTDGCPNVDTPNEEAEYNYLKEKYPYITINGVQYEMGSTILDPIKKISDNQFIANMSTLNNVLFDASVTPLTYDNFEITDYINTEYFDIDKVTPDIGTSKVDNGKVDWTIDKLKSGSNAKLTIDISLKDKYKDKEGLAPTNTKEEIISTIDDIKEDVKSSKTPIIALSYKVIYDSNVPEGCNAENVPGSETKKAYDTVGVSDKKLTCQGYDFKGWEIVNNDVSKINNDYFIMPGTDVTLRAIWSKAIILKKIEGEVYVIPQSIIQQVPYMYNEKIWKYKNSITKIIFQSELQDISNAIYDFDISAKNNGSVMAYLVPNEDDSTTYTAYIQGNGKIYANKDSSFLFYNFTSLKEIEGMELLDTSSTTSFYWMFTNCSELVNLNVNHFNTSKVTNMSNVFGGSRNLLSLDLKSWDTSNVTDMSYMFNNCYALQTINLSNFNTSNVTDMSYMFGNCRNLKALDISHFNTSNVTNMSYMFYDCSGLTSLNVANFDTSKVTTMYLMFNSCSNLRSLDLSSFNTSSVTNMDDMFGWCSSLIELNFSRATFSAEVSYNHIFYNVPSNIEVIVKDSAAKSWIAARLGSGIGTVTIASS